MNKNGALMARARRIDPAPADAFEGLASSIEARETLKAILQSAPLYPGNGGNLAPVSPRGHKIRVGAVARRTVAIGVAATIVLGIATIAAPDRPAPDDQMVWGAELVSIAEQSPRLLLGGDEWKVTRADELSAEIGEMTFENGRDCTLLPLKEGCYWVSLFWRPADTHSDYFKDRERGADNSSKSTIDGHEAVVFEFDNTAVGTTYQAMWLDGEHSLELRSDVIPNLDEFKTIAASLHQVDVDAWLSTMPASVVKPEARDDAIDRIVADIPVPANVDLEELRNSQNVREGHALEAQVLETVVCGWIGQWIDARKTNDEADVREAVNAMAGSQEWAAIEEYGGRSYVFDIADAMANNIEINGNTSLPTGVGYQRHIGCPEG